MPAACGICRPFQILSGPKDGSKVGSIYQLSKLKRMASGAWKGRKAIPQAVRVEYQRLYGPGVEAIFWSPPGTAAQEAKTRYAEWQALIQRRVTALQEAGPVEGSTSRNGKPALWQGSGIGGSSASMKRIRERAAIGLNCMRSGGTPLSIRPVTLRLGKSICMHQRSGKNSTLCWLVKRGQISS